MEPKAGLRIRLLKHMDDPYRGIEAGEEGTIQYVDDARQIHVKWDCGSSLAVIPEIDYYEIFNLNQSLLDFSGMEDGAINEFIGETMISYEIDASISTQILTNGELYEEPIENLGETRWLTGVILGREVNKNIGLSLDDAYLEALRFYKQAEFNLEKAADDFESEYGALL